MITDALLREQRLEQLARDRGANKVRKQIAEAHRRGLGADTPGGVALMKRAVEPITNAIAAALDDANSGRPGRRHSALQVLSRLPAEVSAFLTVRCVVNVVSSTTSLTNAAMSIGSAIEEELRLQAFDESVPGLYATIMRRLKERGAGAGHARRVFVFAGNKHGVDLPILTRTEKLHLGTRLIELLVEATGFAKITMVREGHKTRAMLQPTEEIAKWVEDRNLRAELLSPRYAPMVIPPLDWEGLRGGGYISPLGLPLVKRSSRKQHRELLERADLSLVLRSLNAIQRTPWRVNTRVLEVMSSVWECGLEIAMPNREDRKPPPKPAGHTIAATAPEAWARVPPDEKKRWMRAARTTHEQNASSRGRRLDIAQIIRTAQELAGEEAIYFPHQLDFRGRAYAVPAGLNPQGSDHAKALLTFAHGKPINDPRAAGWLMINGANLFGYDKADFADRIAWVEEHTERIVRLAADPLGDLWWTEADKPWSFLAWCFEYAAFSEHGWGYVSSLPVSVDGSCNGLQHFSAMLRDPIGGAAVNLVPNKLPADIYQRVADRVIYKLQQQRDDWVMRGWLDFGIDRKITKRPVMVLPYGGTFKSCMDYVREAVQERKDGTENPFGDELPKCVTPLARNVWDSIGDVVVAARQAMDWLQKCARAAADKKQPLAWTAPSGFPVFQSYMDYSARRVKTRLRGSLVFLTISEEGDTINRSKQALAVSPNFVHSMDAASMMLTIALALDNGVVQFAMIHDSYGTVAADMDMLAACLRHAFVDMYEEHNVLQEFVDGQPDEVRADCPPPPPYGALNIKEVLNSEFFFA